MKTSKPILVAVRDLPFVREDHVEKIDPRSREKSGKLRYNHERKKPEFRPFVGAEVKRERGQRWIYWRWTPNAGEKSCGYSGMTGEGVDQTFVLVQFKEGGA